MAVLDDLLGCVSTFHLPKEQFSVASGESIYDSPVPLGGSALGRQEFQDQLKIILMLNGIFLYHILILSTVYLTESMPGMRCSYLAQDSVALIGTLLQDIRLSWRVRRVVSVRSVMSSSL